MIDNVSHPTVSCDCFCTIAEYIQTSNVNACFSVSHWYETMTGWVNGLSQNRHTHLSFTLNTHFFLKTKLMRTWKWYRNHILNNNDLFYILYLKLLISLDIAIFVWISLKNWTFLLKFHCHFSPSAFENISALVQLMARCLIAIIWTNIEQDGWWPVASLCNYVLNSHIE